MLEKLEQIGFSKKEALVYLALLKLGPTTSGPLIKKVGIHRQLVYETLNKLTNEGLVSHTLLGKKKLFQAESPEIIKQKIAQINNTANELVPKLEELQKQALTKHEAKVFLGVKGVKAVLFDALKELKSKETFYVIGAAADQFFESTKYFYPHWNKQREEKKIKRKMVTYPKQYFVNKPLISHEKYQEIRMFPEQFETPATTWLFAKKVAIVVWNKEPIIVLIESESVYESYLNYFKIIWRDSKKA